MRLSLKQSLSYMLWMKIYSMTFSLESESKFYMCIEFLYDYYLSHDLYFVYVMEVFITLN